MQFELTEFSSRIDRLRAELQARDLDAILIDDSEAIAYFAGYDTSLSYYRAGVVPAKGEAFFVLRALDVAPMKERTWIDDVDGYPDWEHPAAAIARKVRERGLDRARVGIDLASHALTVQMFEALKRELPDVEFTDVDNLPWKLRKAKSASEIAKIRKACEIGDKTTLAIIRAAKPGISEREAVRMAVESFVRFGGDPGHHGVITAGRGWDFLHGHIHDDPLEAGDVLHLEICPRFEGYGSRQMRCVVLGPIPSELEAISRTMIDLQDKQLAAMKPGAKAKDVDRIMREGALNAGIRQHYHNITGYTMGYYPDFWIRASDFTWVFLPSSEWTLEEGMVFHMYTSAGGIAISETVLINATGAERLTRVERKLFSSAA